MSLLMSEQKLSGDTLLELSMPVWNAPRRVEVLRLYNEYARSALIHRRASVRHDDRGTVYMDEVYDHMDWCDTHSTDGEREDITSRTCAS